jgi:hypothetical protein
MAYCPQCGLEQRCGCDECHTCGSLLVETKPDPGAVRPAGARGRAGRPAAGSARHTQTSKSPAAPPGTATVNWFAHVFFIIGLAVLLVSLLEMINTVKHFPALGPFSTAGEGLGRAAFYAGILLYTSSTRIMTGFGLLAGGVLYGRTAQNGMGWDRAVRISGLVMGGFGAAYLLAALCLLLPFGASPYLLRTLLPTLWVAVPILLVTGAALAGAGYLMAARLATRRGSLRGRSNRERPGTAVEGDGDSRGYFSPGRNAEPTVARAQPFGAERGGGGAD